jgi:ribosomal protein L21E
MAGNVSAGFNEAEAGEQVSVTIDLAVSKGWMVPMGSCAGETGMATAR